MGSNKEAQAARNAADRRLREKFPEVYAILMQDEHAKRGLTWKRRATAEERAERKAEEARRKNEEKIRALAKESGLSVTIDYFSPEEDARLDEAARQIVDGGGVVYANEPAETV